MQKMAVRANEEHKTGIFRHGVEIAGEGPLLPAWAEPDSFGGKTFLPSGPGPSVLFRRTFGERSVAVVHETPCGCRPEQPGTATGLVQKEHFSGEQVKKNFQRAFATQNSEKEKIRPISPVSGRRR
ncbi:hypothetical protein QUW15_12540, partial [Desulfovibrio piger]|nr:hypothetical protein [Desulfovibrio piger]